MFKYSKSVKEILSRGADLVGSFLSKITEEQVQEVLSDLSIYLDSKLSVGKPSRVSYLQLYFKDFPRKEKETRDEWRQVLDSEPRYNALKYIERRVPKGKGSGSGSKNQFKRIVSIIKYLQALSPDFVMRRLQSYDAYFEMLTTKSVFKDAEAEKILALAKIPKAGRKAKAKVDAKVTIAA